MLPPLAFPMHYYPAAQCKPILPFIAKGLDCQFQRSAAAWPTPVGANKAVSCGLPVTVQELPVILLP
jgi:hypothetical protein